MADLPFPDSGISQETREAMYPDTYSDKLGKVYTNLIDEIVRQANITIGGEQNRFNASVLRAAINVIRAL
jgi:hypothetical protein